MLPRNVENTCTPIAVKGCSCIETVYREILNWNWYLEDSCSPPKMHITQNCEIIKCARRIKISAAFWSFAPMCQMLKWPQARVALSQITLRASSNGNSTCPGLSTGCLSVGFVCLNIGFSPNSNHSAKPISGITKMLLPASRIVQYLPQKLLAVVATSRNCGFLYIGEFHDIHGCTPSNSVLLQRTWFQATANISSEWSLNWFQVPAFNVWILRTHHNLGYESCAFINVL